MAFCRQEYGVGSHSIFQGISPTQGSNPGLLHCRQIFFFFVLFLPSEPAGKPWGPDRVTKSAPCKHHTLFGMQNLKWLRTEVCSSVDPSTLCHRIRVRALPLEAWVLTGSSHFPDIVGVIYCSNLGGVKVRGGVLLRMGQQASTERHVGRPRCVVTTDKFVSLSLFSLLSNCLPGLTGLLWGLQELMHGEH